MNAEDQRATILAVDDTPANIDVVKGVLSDDYIIQAAVNGSIALKIIEKKKPDLVLLDIMMPEIDGYEVCRRIKADEETRNIPVIFLTAKAEVEDEAKGLALGAVDYITKPISPPILKERVKTHLALQLARRTLEEQNQDLIEAARLRDDVDGITRHDLKGPLTVIIGMPSVLALEENLSQEQRKHLKMIEEAGFKMLNMINMSLDLFKMERRIYNLDAVPIDLVDIMKKLRGEYQSLLVQKKMEIEISLAGQPIQDGTACRAMGEELLAVSLFSNLLKNAIEASPARDKVEINIQPDGSITSVSISNQGAVPAEIRTRFFEKFVTAGKKRGTGLGTYSAKLITETMKGTIELDSSEEKGTTITVKLPAAPAE